MRPSLRFLGLAMIGWAGLRAAAHGVLPGAEIFQIERSEAKAPPIMATEFPPIEPVEPAAPFAAGGDFAPAAMAYAQPRQQFPVPVHYAAASPVPRMLAAPNRRDSDANARAAILFADPVAR